MLIQFQYSPQLEEVTDGNRTQLNQRRVDAYGSRMSVERQLTVKGVDCLGMASDFIELSVSNACLKIAAGGRRGDCFEVLNIVFS